MSSEVCGLPRQEAPLSISFSGSGFLATYQLGVVQCLLSQAPWILHAAPLVLGASAGSLVAAVVVCEIEPAVILDEMLYFASQLKRFMLGPLNPSINMFTWLECVLRKNLPKNAHLMANGRLAVAMTRLPDGQNIMASEFHSNEDVVQALLCSCFVPGYCGVMPPSFKGVSYVDGGLSSMLPVQTAQSRHTLTVSPFSGEIDICPKDGSSVCDMVVSGTVLKVNMANGFRIVNALYPIALETLEQAYDSGYKDAIHFLQNSELGKYTTVQELSSGPFSHYSTPRPQRALGSMFREEMEKEEEIDGQTPPVDNGFLHLDTSREDKLAGDSTEKDVFLDAIQSDLPLNPVSYMGMWGYPMRVLTYMLLSLNLLMYFVYQSVQGAALWSNRMLAWLFCLWLGLKQIIIFVFNMVVCTTRKNVQDRVIPALEVLRWLNVQPQYEGPVENPQGQWRSSLSLQFSSCPPSPSSSALSPNEGSPFPIWLHLDLVQPSDQRGVIR